MHIGERKQVIPEICAIVVDTDIAANLSPTTQIFQEFNRILMLRNFKRQSKRTFKRTEHYHYIIARTHILRWLARPLIRKGRNHDIWKLLADLFGNGICKFDIRACQGTLCLKTGRTLCTSAIIPAIVLRNADCVCIRLFTQYLLDAQRNKLH